MESKLISILIACYNGEKYIDKCLKSCTTQSYKNIEILVINDGSNDKSLNILNKWKKKDNRIRIISQNNKGLGETRNILVSNANGVYFTFVDIDDYIPIEAIELLSNKAFNLDYDIVTGRTILDYQNKKIKIPFIPT
jgi:glycosyltransferase involved in cell wall biosynthesis